MKTPARLLLPLAALVALTAAGIGVTVILPVSGGSPVPGSSPVAAEPVSTAAAPQVGRTAGESAGNGAAGPDGDFGAIGTARNEALPQSRLLRGLSGRAAQLPSSSTASRDEASAAPGPHPAGTPVGSVLHGCPRALLGSLLAEAAETGDAVSALAIERETLALCRERQEIVNGIVTLENELEALRAAWREAAAGSAAPEDAPYIEESTPVTVVRRLDFPPEDAEAETPVPEESPPPAYAWFSIIGSAGDLQAGVSDGARVWFVREGDRLPGGVTIEGIDARPPAVRAAGEETAALPYRPRSEAAPAAAGVVAGSGP